MNNSSNNTERGQAIVYLVIGLVVFLGFVALAIDGGMALADRRNSQNGADAASLAGGGEAARVIESGPPICYKDWSCSDVGDAIAHAQIEARNRALTNNFDIDNNVSDHNGYDVTCEDDTGKYIDVSVLISDTTPSNFLQLIFPSALHNEVEAVTRVHPRQPIGIDAAVVGLNPGDCSGGNGVTVNGSGTTYVSGGGIFSNGCVQGNGNAGSAVVITGTVEGHYLSPGNLSWDPAPSFTSQTIQPSEYLIPPPLLDGAGNCIEGTEGVDVFNVTSLPDVMDPGLWCVKGNLNINKDITGHDVTIYLKNGHIFYNGSAEVILTASTDPDAYPEIPGVLLYVPNGASVTINGTSDDFFSGLIYAPKSQVSLTGNAENVFNGQVIGWDVKVGGTNDFFVYYDDCTGYQRPTFIELFK